MQLEATRIVTGTTRSISTIKLYNEIGWLTLEDRRKYQKFVLTFKIKNDMVQDYLNNLFPRVDIEQLRYGLRHMSDFVNLPRRTALFENSFVPSAIQQWNSLPCHLRQCPSLATFKRELLRSKFPSRTVPLHFLHGDRLLSSLHARMRNNCSNLKCDLFVNHLSETYLCEYCNVPENANHFFSLYPVF